MAVAAVVAKRLDEMEATGPERAEARKASDEAAALVRARQLREKGQLDESTIDTALAGNDPNFVVCALAVLAEMPVSVVRKTVATQSAKGITAITWKAGLSVTLAEQLQAKLLRLPAPRVLRGRDGVFPLTGDEMIWQLEFLAG
uniref:Protein conserved in bacteria n=1 Tax=Magnetospirillum gryphiswaldense TaxID=55518 RepID=A4TWP5_9PROT|nr:protein conserved in bacteria [Magnetospirillum gryphiswaldense MSR-1]